jgi:putative ABC transport system substrate-binding protein
MRLDQVRRRELITLLGGAAAWWSLAARAQQSERVRRIGALFPQAVNDTDGQAHFVEFVQELQRLGWSAGRNVRIDARWAAGNVGDLRKYAAELVALAPDVLLCSSTSATAALQQVTRTVPIVFATAVDPVGGGLVDSLGRPGGNVTGFSLYEYSMTVKWLELLKEIAPGVKRVGVLRSFSTAGIGQFAAIQGAAPSFGMEISPINVGDAAEIERAVAAFAQSPNGGLAVTGAPSTVFNRKLITHLAVSACDLRRPPVRYRGRTCILRS